VSPRRLVVEADGGSRGNPGPAGYGAVVTDGATGEVLAERAAGIGRATNNVAEYGGLIAGLTAALDLDPSEVEVRMDSKLVVEQMSGRWQVKHPAMKPLAREAADLVARLPRVRFTWIPRERNTHADRLANEAMDAAARGDVWRAGGNSGPPDAADAFLAATAEPRGSGSGAVPSAAGDVGSAGAACPAHADRPTTGWREPSALRRARETADAAAAAAGLQVFVEDGLRETDFGDWEGHTFAEVRRDWPRELDAWLADSAVAPPGGESFDATTTRVRQARDRVLAAYGGRTVLLVSHVSPIKTLLRLALDAPPSAMYRLHLDLACLSEVQWYADGPAVVRRLNDTHHLDGLVAPSPG